jgi:hypothetical protein
VQPALPDGELVEADPEHARGLVGHLDRDPVARSAGDRELRDREIAAAIGDQRGCAGGELDAVEPSGPSADGKGPEAPSR